MKNIFNYISLIILLLSATLLQAQTNSVDSLNNKLFVVSNRYVENTVEYRVISRSTLDAYFKDIKTIDVNKTQSLADCKNEIIKLNGEIETGKTNYDALNTKYKEQKELIDGISFFGTIIAKSLYKTIITSLICVLSVIIIVLLGLFNKNLRDKKHAKLELEEKINEFEAYRKRSLKREQESGAAYMSEINKLKGILNN